MAEPHIVFISTMMGAAWGGSEELWSQTAHRLASDGAKISVSVPKWDERPRRIELLISNGVAVQRRPMHQGLWTRIRRRLIRELSAPMVSDIRTFLRNVSPSLVIVSDGGSLPPIDVIDMCIERKWPFVTIGHSSFDYAWPDDSLAERYRGALPFAKRCYFISRSTLNLVQKQLGDSLSNAQIVHNPYNVDFGVNLPWPATGAYDELRLACVASLHPGWKGQDILLETLARPSWSNRSWLLTLYGDGPSKVILKRLVDRLGLGFRIRFAGHVASIVDVWKENHVLVQPSRCEGLPMSVVEAMLCGRPVIATDVGGHSELIDDGYCGFLAAAPTVTCMSEALERLWMRRLELEELGRAAACKVRSIVPDDPIQIFCDHITSLIRPRND